MMQNIRIINAKNGGFLVHEDVEQDFYNVPIAALSNSGDLLRWMTEQFIKPKDIITATEMKPSNPKPSGDEWIFNTNGRPPGYYPYKLYEYQLRNGVIGRTSNDLDLNWTIGGDSPHAVIKHRVIPETKPTPEPEQDGFITKEPEWIEWDGGSNPCREKQAVEIRLRSGSKAAHQAFFLDWQHSGSNNDIVAYRVLS